MEVVRHPADAYGGCIEKFLVNIVLIQCQFPSTEVFDTTGHMHAKASRPAGRIRVDVGAHVFETTIYTLMAWAWQLPHPE